MLCNIPPFALRLVFSLNDIEQLALSDRFPAACDAEFCNPARLQPLSEVLRRNQLSLQPLSEAPLQRSVRLVINESHKDVDAFEVNLVGVVETAFNL